MDRMSSANEFSLTLSILPPSCFILSNIYLFIICVFSNYFKKWSLFCRFFILMDSNFKKVIKNNKKNQFLVNSFFEVGLHNGSKYSAINICQFVWRPLQIQIILIAPTKMNYLIV